MAETTEQPAAGIGDNRGPPLFTPADLQLQLGEDHAALFKRRDDLLAGEERVPPIDNDEEAAKLGDFIRQITALARKAEGARVTAKEPFLEAERAVDGFFKQIVTPLDNPGRGAKPGLKQRLQDKLTAYQVEQEKKERARREEAARLAREAEEREAERARQKAAEMRNQQELDDALDAQANADKAAVDAADATRAAQAKPADLSRVRGDMGAVASLRTFWDFKDLSRVRVALEPLREHLPMDGLERAVRSFVRAGGRRLDGVTIYERKETQVR